MPLNKLDATKPIVWMVGDLLQVQQHNLNFDENGIGRATATNITYDGRVLELSEDGSITKAILQNRNEDGNYNQHTMPLKKVESLMKIKEDSVIALETYEPFYQEEIPLQRYLFTILVGFRNED